jgi:hypothetical protein
MMGNSAAPKKQFTIRGKKVNRSSRYETVERWCCWRWRREKLFSCLEKRARRFGKKLAAAASIMMPHN